MPNIPASAKAPLGFHFPEIKGRPFRVVSIETEVDGDNKDMPLMLYEKGYVATPRVENYGYAPYEPYTCLGFIKYDGSVSGGEIVFDRMDLTQKPIAELLHEAYEELYVMERSKRIATNPNCGGHITIDAAGYGHYDLLRLLIIFGYLEEPIFRLAGAGKKYGHRSLYPGHDRAAGGGGYANPVVKGPFVPIKDTYTKVFGMKRMSAINVGKMRSVYPCRCGKSVKALGGYADTKDCTCPSLNKCLEWRIWNSQTNPRILYAWIGFMQALHAYAWRPSGRQYTKYEDMTPLTWRIVAYYKLTEKEKKAAQERVEWIFKELPLTAEEKSALAYAFMRTPYRKWGKAWFDKLVDTPYKPPPYANQYKTKIARDITKTPFDPEERAEERPEFEVDAVEWNPPRQPIYYEYAAPQGHPDNEQPAPFIPLDELIEQVQDIPQQERRI